MDAEQNDRPNHQSKFDRIPVIAGGVFSLALLASLWLFLAQPNQRIAGIAVNALFLIFGCALSPMMSIYILVKTIRQSVPISIGLPTAFLVCVVAAYCVYHSFSIFLSV